jgi:GTP pyrophosphokinase
MPRGATPVDFAYAVHSAVGDHCVGAKINGRIMPLRTVLQNGDQVDIITSKARTPSPVWERFVVTGKARARIRRFVRTQQRDQYVEMGRSLVQRAFKAEGHDLQERLVEGVLRNFNLTALDDLYAAVGEGLNSAREVVLAVHPQTVEPRDKVVPLRRGRAKPARGEGGIPIRGLIPGMAVHYAGCCHPLPGDRIVGIVTTGKGVTIHHRLRDAGELRRAPERWVDVGWDGTPADRQCRPHPRHPAQRAGSMGNLTTIIGKNRTSRT